MKILSQVFFFKSLISTTSCTRKFRRKVLINNFYFITKGQIKTEHRRLDYRSVPSKWWSNIKRWSLLLFSSPKQTPWLTSFQTPDFIFQVFSLSLKKKKKNQRQLATYWVFLYILLNLRRKHWEVPIEYNLSQRVHQRSIMYNQKYLLKEEREKKKIRHIYRIHSFTISLAEHTFDLVKCYL